MSSRSFLCAPFTFLLIICLTGTSVNKVSSQQPTAQHKFRLIELTGSGYERGFQHGQQLKNEIAEVYLKWKANIERNSRKHPDSVLRAFRAAIDFEPVIRKYCPSLLEELKGIAAGSGQ